MKKHIFGILLATIFTGSLHCMQGSYFFTALTRQELAAFHNELPFFLDYLTQEEARLSHNAHPNYRTQEELANVQDIQQLARQMKKPSERRTRPQGIRKAHRAQGGHGPRKPRSF